MKINIKDEVAKKLSDCCRLWLGLSQMTFNFFKREYGQLTDRQKLFIEVCNAVIDIHDFDYAKWVGVGRKPVSRLNVCKAFIMKHVYSISTTKALVEFLRSSPADCALCGWQDLGSVPSESKFCCIFEEFVERNFVNKWFEKFITDNHGVLYTDTISYDSVPILVRAKASPSKRELAENDPDQPKPPSRLDDQLVQSAEQSLRELPQDCDWGCKLDSQGKRRSWKGGKLHAACTSTGIPVAWTYTSASLHDSQAMIPLAQQAAERVPHGFDLADAAYDSRAIRRNSEFLNTTPIIKVNRRWNGDFANDQMTAKEKEIFKQRSSVERLFSHILDAHGGRTVRVRTPKKIALHLAFGMLVVAVEQFMRMIC